MVHKSSGEAGRIIIREECWPVNHPFGACDFAVQIQALAQIMPLFYYKIVYYKIIHM